MKQKPLFTQGHALVIGISQYNLISQLPEAVLHDARDFSSVLTDPNLCGYPADQVTCLLDQNATKENIEEGLHALAQNAKSNDTVVIFFSGHGAQVIDDSESDAYLLSVETNLQNLAETALHSDELTRYLQKIKANRIVLFLDCCHAGGIGDIKGGIGALSQGIIKDGLDDQVYDKLSEGKGSVIIASSQAHKVSWVLPNMRNSLFTHFVLEGLRGHNMPHDDGLIRILALYQMVAKHVPAYQSDQLPMLKASIEADFPIALHTGGPSEYQPLGAEEMQTKLIIPSHIEDISAPERTALKKLLQKFVKAVFEKEFGEGRTDTRVFLIIPYESENSYLSKAIVKIGPKTEIETEKRAFDQLNMHLKISRIIRYDEPFIPDTEGLAGLFFSLAGDGRFDVESLRLFLEHASTEQIKSVFNLLAVSFDQAWRQAGKTIPGYPMCQSYDPILPVNLLVDALPISNQHSLMTISPEFGLDVAYEPGQYVELRGLQIAEIDPKQNQITLNLPNSAEGDALPSNYRIRVNVTNIANYSIGELLSIPLTGVVKATRTSIFQKQLQDLVDITVHVFSEAFTYKNISLPNPLIALPKILQTPINMKMGYIHGDLNLENILVESQQSNLNIHLIDLARARYDHVFHDFLRLESNLIFHVLPKLIPQTDGSYTHLYALYRSLHQPLTEQTKSQIPAHLQPVFEAIYCLRQTAVSVLSQYQNWESYYAGLVIYLLGGLKFKLDPWNKTIAFLSAAIYLDSRNWVVDPKPLPVVEPVAGLSTESDRAEELAFAMELIETKRSRLRRIQIQIAKIGRGDSALASLQIEESDLSKEIKELNKQISQLSQQ